MVSFPTASVQSSYLRYPFLGEVNGVRGSKVSIPLAALVRKNVEWKESRNSRPLTTMTSSVMPMKECQGFKVEFDEEKYDLRKLMDAGRTNQIFSLLRSIIILFQSTQNV